jgi:hypothetical protein
MNMREDLKAFIDNELSESERTRILREIDADPQLQAEVIELRQMSRTISEGAKHPAPVGLEKTLAALSRPAAPARPWWTTPALQWAIGGIGAVILVAVMFPVFAQSKSGAEKLRYPAAEVASAPASAVPNRSRMESKAMAGAAGGEMAEAPAEYKAADMATASPSTLRSPGVSNPIGVDISVAKGGPQFEIKTAQLSVEVEDVPKAQTEAEGIAKAVNGRIESSSKQDNEGQLASAEVTLRVPVAAFQVAVNRIRQMGRVISDSLSGEDVTTQVVDIEARLKVMRAEEDQYVELLRETKKIGEVLSVKERLSRVRQEIEALDAQQKVLKAQAAESTIHLSLTERPKPDRPRQSDNWFEDAWSKSVSALNTVGRALGSALVFIFTFSPIWLPIVLIGWWLARRSRR